MVFKILGVLVPWAKLALALEVLSVQGLEVHSAENTINTQSVCGGGWGNSEGWKIMYAGLPLPTIFRQLWGGGGG